MADKAPRKKPTIDEAAREAGFALGATVQPGGIMLAGYRGPDAEAFGKATEAATSAGIAADRYRIMHAVDGTCITIETQPLPKEG